MHDPLIYLIDRVSNDYSPIAELRSFMAGDIQDKTEIEERCSLIMMRFEFGITKLTSSPVNPNKTKLGDPKR